MSTANAWAFTFLVVGVVASFSGCVAVEMYSYGQVEIAKEKCR